MHTPSKEDEGFKGQVEFCTFPGLVITI